MYLLLRKVGDTPFPFHGSNIMHGSFNINPTVSIHSANAVLMSGHRLLRCPSINSALTEYVVFAVKLMCCVQCGTQRDNFVAAETWQIQNVIPMLG